MDMEEIWCADCTDFVGYYLGTEPRSAILCGPCGQKRKSGHREDDEPCHGADDTVCPSCGLGDST